MKIIIEIAKDCSSWSEHKEINKNLMKALTVNVMNRFANLKPVKEFELSVLLTNDRGMLKLNDEFRDVPKATNVLSFPDIQLNWQRLLEFKPNLNYMYLGDVAFGYEIVKKEAIDQSKTLLQHYTHLFVHSILHLIGFDHKNDSDAVAMENLEIEVLKDFAISSPYVIKDSR